MLILESFLNWTVHDFLPLIMISSAQTLVMIGVSPKAPLICEEEHINEEFRYCQRASLHWLFCLDWKMKFVCGKNKKFRNSSFVSYAFNYKLGFKFEVIWDYHGISSSLFYSCMTFLSLKRYFKICTVTCFICIRYNDLSRY